MKSFTAAHPWIILAVGALIQIFTGIPAVWSVFRPHVMEEYALSAEAAERIFSLMLGSFGPGCILGGFLQDRRGPRAAGLWGTALLVLGLFTAGSLPAGAPLLFDLGFSLPSGLGSALLYPAVMSCAQSWYRERKGLAAGIIGGAVGISGTVLTGLVTLLVPRRGIRACFRVLAAVVAVIGTAGSLLLTLKPPEKQRPQDQGRNKRPALPDYTPRQMLRTPQFWLCFLASGFAAPTVQLFSPIFLALAQERGLSVRSALLALSLSSVCSAGGRLLMPVLSDRLGRRRTQLLLFAALTALSLVFRSARSWQMAAVYCGLCFCYAGQAAVLPALSADLFGLHHAGINCGFAVLGMSLGSMCFPLLARQTGPEQSRHLIAACAAASGLLCFRFLRPTPGGTV